MPPAEYEKLYYQRLGSVWIIRGDSAWRIHYNQSRPHSALGWITPLNTPKNLPVARICSQHEVGYS